MACPLLCSKGNSPPLSLDPSHNNAHRAVVLCHSTYIQNSDSRNEKNRATNGQFLGPTPFFTFEVHRDTRAVDCVVQYFYRWDYEVPDHTRDAKTHAGVMYQEDFMTLEGPELITHVRVFAMADRYRIHPLKSLSVAKFEAAARHFEKAVYFVEAALEAYDPAVSDGAPEMRDSIVEFIHKRWYLLHEDHIKKLMLDKLRLSFDLHLRYSPVSVAPSSFYGLGMVFHQMKE